jgi:hypothetical protein
VEAGLSTLDAGDSTAQQLAVAMRTVLDAFDHLDLDDEGQTLADKLPPTGSGSGPSARRSGATQRSDHRLARSGTTHR